MDLIEEFYRANFQLFVPDCEVTKTSKQTDLYSAKKYKCYPDSFPTVNTHTASFHKQEMPIKPLLTSCWSENSAM